MNPYDETITNPEDFEDDACEGLSTVGLDEIGSQLLAHDLRSAISATESMLDDMQACLTRLEALELLDEKEKESA